MDDQQLVKQVLAGNDAALKLLIERFERLVMHMVARVIDADMDREEICQDVFIKIYEKLGTFKFDSKLSTWIATVAYRTAVNFAKKKRLDQVDLDAVTFKIGEEENPTEQEDMTAFVHSLVDQLPVNYRTVLTLFYLDGFSYPEIVEITEMPEGTVKNYIHRARAKLREIVEAHADKEIALI